MGVDEAGHHELARGVDDSDVGFRRKVWSDALDLLAADQDIDLRRLMNVAIMVVDATAADQNGWDPGGAGHFIFPLTFAAILPIISTISTDVLGGGVPKARIANKNGRLSAHFVSPIAKRNRIDDRPKCFRARME
jgi:hypothetical protein